MRENYDLARMLLSKQHLQTARRLLDEKEADATVGIPIVDLDMPPVEYEGQIYKFHAARIKPGKWVGAHWHGKGMEPYAVWRSIGEMNIGSPRKTRPPAWESPEKLMAGDMFVVKGRKVHCMRNIGEGDLDFGFACPDDHLSEADRFMVTDLPPHFPSP